MPSPNWPSSFEPQHDAEPLPSRPHECRPPAATIPRSIGNDTADTDADDPTAGGLPVEALDGAPVFGMTAVGTGTTGAGRSCAWFGARRLTSPELAVVLDDVPPASWEAAFLPATVAAAAAWIGVAESVRCRVVEQR